MVNKEADYGLEVPCVFRLYRLRFLFLLVVCRHVHVLMTHYFVHSFCLLVRFRILEMILYGH